MIVTMPQTPDAMQAPGLVDCPNCGLRDFLAADQPCPRCGHTPRPVTWQYDSD